MNELPNWELQNWKKTGLLDNLQEKHHTEMADILQDLMEELVEIQPGKKTSIRKEFEKLSGTILPIARRIFDEIGFEKFPTSKWLIEDYQNYRKTHQPKSTGNDPEADFVSEYCNEIIGRILK